MKKVLFSLVFSVFSVAVFAVPRTLDYATGAFSENASASVPVRTMTENSENYEVTYKISSVVVNEDQYNPGYFRLMIPGFNEVLAPGEPAFLSRRDRFWIPAGYVGSVELVSCEYRDFDIPLAPSREILLDNGKENAAATPLRKYSGFLPSEPVAFLRNNKYRGAGILELGVYPVLYNQDEKKARLLTQITYRVNLVETGLPAKANSEMGICLDPDDPFLDNICLNKTADSGEPGMRKGIFFGDPVPPSMNTETYIIITKEKYREAVEKFAAWKRKLGFNPRVFYGDWSSSETVADSINSVGNNPRYLLIIGDSQDVPGVQKNEYDAKGSIIGKYYSDRPYAFFAGNDGAEPDMLYGRLSVNSLASAKTVVDKIIQYEENPPAEASFYKRAIGCATFEDDGDSSGNGRRDRKEDRRFSQTMFEIIEYMNYNRIGPALSYYFKAESNVFPERWFEPKLDYSSGTGVSETFSDAIIPQMQKPVYPWNATASDIKKDWNSNGCIFVMNRGHGGYNIWKGPDFTSSDAASLTNRNKLPVVFSINCLSGKYNGTTCLAEELLRNKNGGGVGVLAAAISNSTNMNDVLAHGIINSFWPNPGMKTKFLTYGLSGRLLEETSGIPVYRLGQIYQQAISTVREGFGNSSKSTQRYLEMIENSYHFFGDPSMMLRTDMPEEAQCEVTIKDGKIIMNPEAGCSVGMTDQSTGITCFLNGSNFFLPYEQFKNAEFTVSGPNRIPVSFTPSSRMNKSKAINANRTVREDRIWQYESTGGHDDCFTNMRFYGTTEIEGKTYYNCYIYPSDREFSTDKDNMFTKLYAYVREEDGKVYSHWPEWILRTGVVFDPMYYSQVNYRNVTSGETLVYDFSLGEGETYYPLDKSRIVEFEFLEKSAETNGRFAWKVASKDYVEVGNDRMASFTIVPEADESRYLFTFVEGIGRVSGLCNFMPMPLRQETRMFFRCDCELSEKGVENKMVFRKLMDLDGNVLYSTNASDVDVAESGSSGNDVYGIDGTLVMRGASKEDVARLDKGIYIVGGKKVMVR